MFQVVPRATTALLPVPTPTFAGPITFLNTPEPIAVVQTADQARNFTWVYLTRCTSFDPGQLVAYQVKEDWFVKAQTGSRLDFGIWKVDSETGDLEPHDVKSREWRPYIESSCSPEIAATLFPVTPMPTITVAPSPTPTKTPSPTRTPTPIPTATPVVPNTSDAVASVWSYLVKCFPKAELADFKSVLDPVNDQYVVKDKDEIQYGVWRVDQDDGDITPDNGFTRARDQIIRSGNC